MQPTPDQVLRLNVLQLANLDSASESGEDVVAKAQAFFNFVKGEAVVETTNAGTENVAEAQPETDKAPVKRTRKTKSVEVIEAPVEEDKAVEVAQAVADLLEPEAKAEEVGYAKIVDYKEVQVAVLNLVRNKQPDGKERVIEILNQFGVATALDLKPEQDAKALEMFVCAFEQA